MVITSLSLKTKLFQVLVDAKSRYRHNFRLLSMISGSNNLKVQFSITQRDVMSAKIAPTHSESTTGFYTRIPDHIKYANS